MATLNYQRVDIYVFVYDGIYNYIYNIYTMYRCKSQKKQYQFQNIWNITIKIY